MARASPLVAGEVKAWPSDAKATEEISQQIAAVQDATARHYRHRRIAHHRFAQCCGDIISEAVERQRA